MYDQNTLDMLARDIGRRMRGTVDSCATQHENCVSLMFVMQDGERKAIDIANADLHNMPWQYLVLGAAFELTRIK